MVSNGSICISENGGPGLLGATASNNLPGDGGERCHCQLIRTLRFLLKRRR